MVTRDKVLVVDDAEINRMMLCKMFEEEYQLLEAENGDKAIQQLEKNHSTIAVVLLDLIMPVKDGYQVLEHMRLTGVLEECPVIVITAESSTESELKAFELGASDIIIKPFEHHVVKRRVQNVVELNLRKLHQQELIEEQAMKLRESNAVMIEALSSIIEYRSLETGKHIQRIRMYTRVVLEEFGRMYPQFDLDERLIEVISSASAMHDIGKIAIPDSILNKPGKFTSDEFSVMKTHTVRGCEMLASLSRVGDREYLNYAYQICRHHHERWDGGGYPDGLTGKDIPICAQIVGVADCYDALTEDRVYRKAIPEREAFQMILEGECGKFGPNILKCLRNVHSEFAELSRRYADG